MRPINRVKQKRRYLWGEAFLWLFVVFFALHLGKVGFKDISDLPAGFDHMIYHPLAFFPINTAFLGGGALIGFIPALLLHTEFLRRRDLRPMEESGSARWNENLKSFYQDYAELDLWPEVFHQNSFLRKLKKILCRISSVLDKIPVIRVVHKKVVRFLAEKYGRLEIHTGTKNMVFSKNIAMSMDTRKTRRNNNVLVIGGSGTGKSRFFVKPNLLQANCSYIITDPSGELLETMGSFLINQGYELRVFNLVEMEHSNCYNPFHYIRNQEGVLIMINALIKNTTPKGSSTNDPFWEKAETALLQAICFYLISCCNKEDQNFSNVMKLLRCAKAVEGQEDVDSTLDILFKDLAAKDPEHIAVQSYAVFKSAGGGKTAQSILISCQTRLQTFNLDAIKKLTSTDTIDLGSVGDKKVALFCITPSADTTFNYLVALMYTQLFETLYHHAETDDKNCPGKRLRSHVRFLLDEFANVGTIPEFSQKLATMRKYEISCSIIIQALSQIKAMYKDEWEVLIGNCDSLLFLGGADQTTLEYISKTLGKETIRSINNSRSWGKQGSYSMSYNKSGRELLTSDELRVMNNQNCVLFIRGLYPFFTEKYPLEKHPNFAFCGDGEKKYLFDVKKEIQTGQNTASMKIRDDRPARIFQESQIADTRETVYEHRRRSRPIQKKTLKGEDNLCTVPVSKVFPHYGVPDEQLSPEAIEERNLAMGNYVLEDVHIPREEEHLEEYYDEFAAVMFEIDQEYFASDRRRQSMLQYVETKVERGEP